MDSMLKPQIFVHQQPKVNREVVTTPLIKLYQTNRPSEMALKVVANLQWVVFLHKIGVGFGVWRSSALTYTESELCLWHAAGHF